MPLEVPSMNFHPPLNHIPTEGLEYQLVNTANSRLEGEVWLSTVGLDGVEQSPLSVARLERGSALFVDLVASQFRCNKSCWFRAEYLPSASCSADGALCSCAHSGLLVAGTKHPQTVKLGPSPIWATDDNMSNIGKIQDWSMYAPVACVMDGCGNVSDGPWSIFLRLDGSGWSQDISRRCIGGYADFRTAVFHLPGPGEYTCTATLNLDNVVVGTQTMRVSACLPAVAEPAVSFTARPHGDTEQEARLLVAMTKAARLQQDATTAEIPSALFHSLALELLGADFSKLNCLREVHASISKEAALLVAVGQISAECTSMLRAIEECAALHHRFCRSRTKCMRLASVQSDATSSFGHELRTLGFWPTAFQFRLGLEYAQICTDDTVSPASVKAAKECARKPGGRVDVGQDLDECIPNIQEVMSQNA